MPASRPEPLKRQSRARGSPAAFAASLTNHLAHHAVEFWTTAAQVLAGLMLVVVIDAAMRSRVRGGVVLAMAPGLLAAMVMLLPFDGPDGGAWFALVAVAFSFVAGFYALASHIWQGIGSDNAADHKKAEDKFDRDIREGLPGLFLRERPLRGGRARRSPDEPGSEE